MLRSKGRAIGVAATVLAATPASAQVICGEREPIIRELEAEYAERPRALGLTADGKVVEVFVSPAGTWTMLVSYPNGAACIIGHGTDWQAMPVPVAGDSS